ncbi:MAG: TetR/AcrR family transcriptional regulator [Sandaracinus sp.]
MSSPKKRATRSSPTARRARRGEPRAASVRPAPVTASVAVASTPAERPGAPGGKRDRNRRERTTQLGQTALALFLARGIEVVTIDDICHAAEVAKGSFYRYFADKEALVEALVSPVDRAVRDALDGCEARLREAEDPAALNAAYQGLALSLFPVALGHLDVFRLYLQERAAPPVGARAPLAAFARTVDEGSVRLTQVAVDRGLLHVSDPRISAFAVVGAIERLAHAVLHGNLDASPIDILTTLIRLVLDGVRARSKSEREARS